jgi:hypothetical protein
MRRLQQNLRAIGTEALHGVKQRILNRQDLSFLNRVFTHGRIARIATIIPEKSHRDAFGAVIRNQSMSGSGHGFEYGWWKVKREEDSHQYRKL